jgi:pimeloyl-ACP methyl ester carboxylesterase
MKKAAPFFLAVLILAGCASDSGSTRSDDTAEGPTPTVKKETPMAPTMKLEAIGKGAPVVMVGGGLTGWISWTPHQEKLAESRHAARAQPLIVQLGLDEEPVPENYSVRMEGDALAAAIDAFHSDGPVDLIGWSYGGQISLDFALNHPERIRSLTLIEPPAFWVLKAHADPLYESEREALRPLADKLRDGVSEEELVEFAEYASFVPPGKRPQDMPNWPVWVKHRNSLRGQFDAEFNHRDTVDRLKKFERPVLLVKGKGSTPALHRILDRLDESLPQSQMVEFEGGHAPHIVEMDPFLEALAKFHAASDSKAQ